MSESLRGKFLVAGPKLRDSNFFKTVVLLLEHTEEGAMGLVLNRPSSLTVGNALAGHLEPTDGEEMVFVGGPVEPADLFLLHTNDTVAGEFDVAPEVVAGLFVTNAADQFEAVLSAPKNGAKTRVFCGYAGWGPGQLEGEIGRGDWLAVDAECDALFGTSVYDLWDDLRTAVTRSHRFLACEDANPELN